MNPSIRVGVGGWTFEPWRNNFYPAGWPHARELEYASQRLTAIEVNGTYYSSQKPATFAKWRDETPDGLRVLAEGLALRHQPARAGRGRRIGAALRAQRHRRTGAQARADRLAVRADQGLRSGRLRGVPEAAAGPGRWRGAAPRARRAPRQLQVPRVPGAGAALPAATVFTDSDDYPQLRRHHRRLRLLPRDAHRRVAARRLHTAGAGADRGLRDACGATAGSPPACRASSPRQHRPQRATCSCSSSAARRRRRRPRRWRCCGS